MTRMFETTMQAARLHPAQQAAGDPLPTALANQRRQQLGSRSSHQLGRLVQTAVRIVPRAHNQKPLLDQQRDNFGKDLAENTTGCASLPFIHMTRILPQVEQTLNLPSCPLQDNHLREAQSLHRHIGNQDRPGRSLQHLRIDGSASAFGLLMQALAALSNDLFWNTHQDQACWQLGLFADQHLCFPCPIAHLGADLFQGQFLFGLRVQETHRPTGPRQKKTGLCLEPVQTAIAFIGDVEHLRANALLSQRTALIALTTGGEQGTDQSALFPRPSAHAA